MRNLLIGLLVLGSLSAFAAQECGQITSVVATNTNSLSIKIENGTNRFLGPSAASLAVAAKMNRLEVCYNVENGFFSLKE